MYKVVVFTVYTVYMSSWEYACDLLTWRNYLDFKSRQTENMYKIFDNQKIYTKYIHIQWISRKYKENQKIGRKRIPE